MGVRPQPLPPLVSLATGAAFLRLSTLFRVARDAGADGIELDLSGRPLPDPQQLVAVAKRHGVPVRSVWVPRSSLWTGWRSLRGLEAAAALARAAGAGSLIVESPMAGDGSVPRIAITARVEAARLLLRPGTRVVVALRHRHLEGGRRHLVQMTTLRRLAEEWEFDVALDLTGALDARWEAEAAVSRLGARLTMIRLPTDVAAGSARSANRAAVRALAAAIDGGHPAQFAVVPAVPFWQSGHVPALARTYADAKRRIADRYATVEEQRTLDVFPYPWPGSRG